MGAPSTIRVALSPKPELLALLRRLVSGVAALEGFSSTHCSELELAVDEACTNSLRALATCRTDGQVELEIAVTTDELIITIADGGDDFSEAFARDVQIEKDLAQYRGSGYGLQIIKTLMTSVEYVRTEGTNRLKMVKHRA